MDIDTIPYDDNIIMKVFENETIYLKILSASIHRRTWND